MTMPIKVNDIEGTRLGLFVDGVFTVPSTSRYLDSYDPATGQPRYQAAEAGPEDVSLAVSAARRAFANPGWRRMTHTARGGMMRRLAELIVEHAEDLAVLETRDNGKVLRENRAQMANIADIYHYFAGITDKVQGDTIPVNKPDLLAVTLREPLGVVGVIVPWNSPLYLMSCAVAPCLAAGNTVVVKPSEHTSASALALAELIVEAGFPPGVVNVVTGYGDPVGQALARHPHVSKMAFTGGSAAGRLVAAGAAEHVAPATLELGGKSPHVVFGDADPERAVRGIVAGIFAAAGQTCVAGSRCFVQKSVAEEILQRLAEHTARIRVGHPMRDTTHIGPLAMRNQVDKVQAYVAGALDDGARLVAGGRTPRDPELGNGWYVEPTVVADVRNDMRIACEEIFGPVASVLTFESESDLLEMANDSEFGLAAGIWTTDIDRALRFARSIDAGTVWVNTYRFASFTTPAGGFKGSGYGKHNGFEVMREYTRLKSVMIDHSGVTPDIISAAERAAAGQQEG
jgi:acyl-CoA reductase-like NAD-dependent aldehyde dehydrogenase